MRKTKSCKLRQRRGRSSRGKEVSRLWVRQHAPTRASNLASRGHLTSQLEVALRWPTPQSSLHFKIPDQTNAFLVPLHRPLPHTLRERKSGPPGLGHALVVCLTPRPSSGARAKHQRAAERPDWSCFNVHGSVQHVFDWTAFRFRQTMMSWWIWSETSQAAAAGI